MPCQHFNKNGCLRNFFTLEKKNLRDTVLENLIKAEGSLL